MFYYLPEMPQEMKTKSEDAPPEQKVKGGGGFSLGMLGVGKRKKQKDTDGAQQQDASKAQGQVRGRYIRLLRRFSHIVLRYDPIAFVSSSALGLTLFTFIAVSWTLDCYTKHSGFEEMLIISQTSPLARLGREARGKSF